MPCRGEAVKPWYSSAGWYGLPDEDSRLTPPTWSFSARRMSDVPSRAMSPLSSTSVSAGTRSRSMPAPRSGDVPITTMSGTSEGLACVGAGCATDAADAASNAAVESKHRLAWRSLAARRILVAIRLFAPGGSRAGASGNGMKSRDCRDYLPASPDPMFWSAAPAAPQGWQKTLFERHDHGPGSLGGFATSSAARPPPARGAAPRSAPWPPACRGTSRRGRRGRPAACSGWCRPARSPHKA